MLSNARKCWKMHGSTRKLLEKMLESIRKLLENIRNILERHQKMLEKIIKNENENCQKMLKNGTLYYASKKCSINEILNI